MDIWDLYDVSTDGEHQEEQPGRRGPATTTSCHNRAADDDANLVASTNGSEHAEYGAWEWDAPPQVRDKRGEFLKGHPPIFKHSTNPLQANDWLRAIERQLEIARCDDKEKVLYAFGQLQGATLDWWDSFHFGRT